MNPLWIRLVGLAILFLCYHSNNVYIKIPPFYSPFWAKTLNGYYLQLIVQTYTLTQNSVILVTW